MDPVTTSNIVKARKSIKRKLEALKRNEQVIERSFAPITNPLKTIAKNIKREPSDDNDAAVKIELKKSEPKNEVDEQIAEKTAVDNASITNSDNADDDYYEVDNASVSSSNTDYDEEGAYLKKFGDLPKSYISALIHDTENDFDVKYGVRYNPDDDNFHIGNSEIKFIDNDNVLISNQEYNATPGLFELMFKKHPRNVYTDADEKNYVDILKDTSAHRLHYDSSKPLSGGNSWKYKHVIKPLLERHHHDGGALMMDVTDNAIDYVYWNDPNELADRLRLLMASQRAGNSNHTNEINSILEELVEAKLIAPSM